MAKPMKTPGVYIKELDAFGNSVVPVPTAVPAFIGFTETTMFNGQSLLNKPVKVTSLAQFLTIFGSNPPKVKFDISSIALEKLDIGAMFEDLTEKETTLADAKEKQQNDEGTLTTANNTLATAQGDLDADSENDTLKEALAQAQQDADAAQEAVDNNIVAVSEAQDLLDASKKEIEIAKESGDEANAAIVAQMAAHENAAAAAAAEPAGTPDAALLTAANDAIASYDEAFPNILSKAQDADFMIDGNAYFVTTKSINYRLYGAMKFFYANGGAECYVTTIGVYDYEKSSITDTGDFLDAIDLLEKEMEPTMLVIPDAVEVYDASVTDTNDANYLLNRYGNAYSLQMKMINHCGNMMSRVAILDIPGGYTERLAQKTSVQQFRDIVEPENPKFNSYAAAYYPWLHTTVYQSSEIGFENIDQESFDQVEYMVRQEPDFKDDKGVIHPEMEKIISQFTETPDQSTPKMTLDKADTILKNLSKSYQQLMKSISTTMNLMAPSAAMAGIYTSVDNNDGVWKAPANVGVQSVTMPSYKIDHEMQQDLNMPISGKSVCAIRAFTGRGNLVWGARTLDGNSNDWRYINVRRTLIYIEQSVKDASKAYVFAPNDASTWVNVQSMISNFLTGLWNQGGLVGPKPADAFTVTVGLGSTMTNDDVLNGIMRVSVKVAVSRPAEFIEITFQQQMQKA